MICVVEAALWDSLWHRRKLLKRQKRLRKVWIKLERKKRQNNQHSAASSKWAWMSKISSSALWGIQTSRQVYVERMVCNKNALRVFAHLKTSFNSPLSLSSVSLSFSSPSVHSSFFLLAFSWSSLCLSWLFPELCQLNELLSLLITLSSSIPIPLSLTYFLFKYFNNITKYIITVVTISESWVIMRYCPE